MAKSGLNKTEAELAALDKAIDEEDAAWAKLGLETNRIAMNGFIINVRTLTIVKILEEVLEIDEDVINFHFKTIMLQELQEAREILQGRLRDMREQALRVDPSIAKAILDAQGRPIQ